MSLPADRAPRVLGFPFGLAADGRVATADAEQVIRQRIEQLLFTDPGERVMLPEFGCGLNQLVFQGNNPLLAAAAEFRIAKALQNFLNGQVMVNAVDVQADGETLRIEVTYTKARELEQATAVYQLLPFRGNNRG